MEQKWQAKWDADKLYRAVIDETRPKHYALTMLPYTSGDLHFGHWYPMAPSDARARYKRMNGYNVLFPIGFDALARKTNLLRGYCEAIGRDPGAVERTMATPVVVAAKTATASPRLRLGIDTSIEDPMMRKP